VCIVSVVSSLYIETTFRQIFAIKRTEYMCQQVWLSSVLPQLKAVDWQIGKNKDESGAYLTLLCVLRRVPTLT